MCNTFEEAKASGPFDVVILGGGTFGLALAQDLFFRAKRFDTGPGAVAEDVLKPPNFRVLVLEAGPFVLPAHVQDIPNLGLFAPGTEHFHGSLPATRSQLLAEGADRQRVLENWGLPWNSTEPFTGVAYCLGGQSLYWGGWSPRYLDTEMHVAPVGAITAQTLWPAVAVQDLKEAFFAEAEEETGVVTSNDFINGALQDHYRRLLFEDYANVPYAIPLTELPDYTPFAAPRLRAQLDDPPYAGFATSTRLDAPLAVQARARPGFFPFSKFSSVPLAITGAREARNEPGAENDAAKRLMIVPNCHVKSLNTRTYTLATGATVEEVSGVDTNLGTLDLAGPIAGNPNRRPVVVLALGAIESARMAKVSAARVPDSKLFGTNLMVHVRKNVGFTVRVPPGLQLDDGEVAALLVRCRTETDVDGVPTPVHFHFQVTASAVPEWPGSQADAFLFQNVPDLDNIRRLQGLRPAEVDVFVRALGEMLPPSGTNSVTVPLDPADPDEFGVPRASVTVRRGPEDTALQERMDEVIQHLAQKVFGATGPVSIGPADGLGTSFHEAGTLRMGEGPATSVVNPDGQFHAVTNLYAGDASVLPTCGSANPVMNGIALRRRLAKRLVPEGDGVGRAGSGRTARAFPRIGPAPVLPPGTVLRLFDGRTLAGWRMAGRGSFHAVDGALQSVPGFDLGLLWSTVPMPPDYRLELEFLTRTNSTNSGVFVRFPNPELAGFYNPAWYAVTAGFEVQVDNLGGALRHRTGAVYDVNYPGDPASPADAPAATPGDFVDPRNARVLAWNQLRIEVHGDLFMVNLNGVDTARYTNLDPDRGRFRPDEPTFVGLQSYSDYSATTAFRDIRVTALAPG
jgi:choline dehydrogenase-like flavoprotein